MLNKILQVALVATSLAPILLTAAIALRTTAQSTAIGCAATAVALFAVSYFIVRRAQRKLEVFTLSVTSIQSADKDVLAFLVTYLIPLIAPDLSKFDLGTALAVITLLFVLVYNSDIYHVNPLLGMLGWHYYQVTTRDNTTYILMSKRSMRSSRETTTVVAVSEYMMLDVEDPPRRRGSKVRGKYNAQSE